MRSMAPRKSSTTQRRYLDLTTLGSGGMAKVYKAHQESLDRPVAIKELKADLARDPSIVARFEREARYAAGLQHESIVHIYDFFKEGTSYYIVMEYVDGTDLGRIIRQVGKIQPEIAALVALRICRALEHAHQKGIVHRDIKPGNALVSRNGEVKLSDFGIAKNPGIGTDDMTQTGQAVGTPSYMSPEQILGDTLTFNSDLFSLGVVIYEMVSGAKPFVADTQGALLDKIRSQGYVDVRRKTSGVPRALAKIIRRSLQKEPRKRWKSTQQMREALEAFALRRLRTMSDGALKQWLHQVGVFVAEGTAVVQAGTAVQQTLGPPRSSWRPKVVFAGLAAIAIAAVFGYPQIVEDSTKATPTPKPSPSASASPTPGRR